MLFLDEWPEFPRRALEALRQLLESGRAVIARANAHVTFPARFQLVAAMSPCRCGHLGEPGRECARVPRCGDDYAQRIPGPLLDRLDLAVEVQAIAPRVVPRAARASASAAATVRTSRATTLPRVPCWRKRWRWSPRAARCWNRRPSGSGFQPAASRGRSAWPAP